MFNFKQACSTIANAASPCSAAPDCSPHHGKRDVVYCTKREAVNGTIKVAFTSKCIKKVLVVKIVDIY